MMVDILVFLTRLCDSPCVRLRHGLGDQVDLYGRYVDPWRRLLPTRGGDFSIVFGAADFPLNMTFRGVICALLLFLVHWFWQVDDVVASAADQFGGCNVLAVGSSKHDECFVSGYALDHEVA
jgi:hypothetical protein